MARHHLPDYLTVNEFAKEMDVSPEAVIKRMNKGHIPFILVGKSRKQFIHAKYMESVTFNSLYNRRSK